MSAPVVTLSEVVIEDLARRCAGGALRLPCAARALRSLPVDPAERTTVLSEVSVEIASARWRGVGRDARDEIGAAVALVMTGRVQRAAATLAHLDSSCSEDESDDDFVAGQVAEWAREQGVEVSR